jgi:hypothetical protein
MHPFQIGLNPLLTKSPFQQLLGCQSSLIERLPLLVNQIYCYRFRKRETWCVSAGLSIAFVVPGHGIEVHSSQVSGHRPYSVLFPERYNCFLKPWFEQVPVLGIPPAKCAIQNIRLRVVFRSARASSRCLLNIDCGI